MYVRDGQRHRTYFGTFWTENVGLSWKNLLSRECFGLWSYYDSKDVSEVSTDVGKAQIC